ncbi:MULTISPECIES: GNAT family N-acetyltransferase [Thioclava]|uniref:GNAT family N-acetyltransferase n=1 Tax=Thioclava kandeliae TaxID=3070818 RepID=A0ABV1SCW6_9RHOB
MARSLYTSRLNLRAFRPEDAPDIVAGLSDFETTRWLGRAPHPYRMSDAMAFLERSMTSDLVWAIEDARGFAGMIGMVGELGYWISPHARGYGYVFEAAHLLVARHFADPRVLDLAAGYFIGNGASARILHRLGFQPDGAPDKRLSVAWGSLRPHQPLRLSRSDWAARAVPRLITDRLEITPLKSSDAGAFHRLVTLPEVGRMLQIFPADWALPEAQGFVARAAWQAARPCRLALRREGRLIGSIGIGLGDCPHLFYFLDPAHSGQGLMGEALASFIAWLESFWGLRQLQARVFTDNPASRHLLEKAGFRHTGSGRGQSAQRDRSASDWEMCYTAPDPVFHCP